MAYSGYTILCISIDLHIHHIVCECPKICRFACYAKGLIETNWGDNMKMKRGK